MNELLLIRHGETVADVERRHEGRADFPLTELGRRQGELVAEWIAANARPDVLLSSPLRRAAETAEIIGSRLGIPIGFVDDLMEIDNGLLAGLTFEEAASLHPQPEGGWKHDEAPPGGETGVAFRARIQGFWSCLTTTMAPGQRIAIVAHGGTIQMLFQSFLGLPLESEVWLRTGFGGMHLWSIEGSQRRILWCNREVQVI